MSQQNTYHPQTAKFIASMCQNMPPLEAERMQKYIENPREIQRVLRVAFNGAEVVVPKKPRPNFPIWKTIKIGTHKDAEDLKNQLIAEDCHMTESTGNLLNLLQFKFQHSGIEVDLVKVSVEELGFAEWPTLFHIYARGIESGLTLCPHEVGPALRLQYLDQPYDEGLLRIAMEPLVDVEGQQNIFSVGHHMSIGYWLRVDRFVNFFKETFNSSCIFLFVLPRRLGLY